MDCSGKVALVEGSDWEELVEGSDWEELVAARGVLVAMRLGPEDEFAFKFLGK